jgi:hypothetical protein
VVASGPGAGARPPWRSSHTSSAPIMTSCAAHSASPFREQCDHHPFRMASWTIAIDYTVAKEKKRSQLFFLKGFFIIFFIYDIQHCFICRPSDSTVSEYAGIEPRTVVTTALTTALTTRLDLIHNFFRNICIIELKSTRTLARMVCFCLLEFFSSAVEQKHKNISRNYLSEELKFCDYTRIPNTVRSFSKS